MFQKDYWQMSDDEIQHLATKYHLDSSKPKTIGYGLDREKAINGLLIRDSALRTKVTTILSIVAMLLSIAAFIKSFFGQS